MSMFTISKTVNVTFRVNYTRLDQIRGECTVSFHSASERLLRIIIYHNTALFLGNIRKIAVCHLIS